jgi:CcmD family protein
MNPPQIAHAEVFLYAAYIVVWVIHCGYALTLVSRGKRLQRESRELKRN